MKIVDLQTFKAMPEGTVFMKFEPCIFGDLCVKAETMERDFVAASLTDGIDASDSGEMADKLFAAMKDPDLSISMDFEAYSRDGMFEDDQMFAVYEKADIEGLVKKLSECLLAYT